MTDASSESRKLLESADSWDEESHEASLVDFALRGLSVIETPFDVTLRLALILFKKRMTLSVSCSVNNGERSTFGRSDGM
jgi:hypothetical protein